MVKTHKENSSQIKKANLNSQDIDDALKMAIDDFQKFCKYAGVDATQLKICIERNKGLTLGQISLKLDVPKSTVRNVCDRCFE